MKAAGVIVEFNPLHNGHIEHLRETKRLTQREHIIAVMSGNFVQRGEPAICDKWRRTRMALLAGVDIVIELPVSYVVSGADYFARASVKLLASTGVVDRLCFGSEIGELAPIKEAGRVLAFEPEEYKTALQNGLKQGMSFAAARGAALEAVLGDMPQGLLTKPNNGLGMEYCKALWQMGWPMDVFTSFRGAGGPSASAIRRGIWGSLEASSEAGGINDCKPAANPSVMDTRSIGKAVTESMPSYALEILLEAIQANEISRLDDYSEIFRYLLLTQEVDMGEGLENRFRHYARFHTGLSGLLDAVKTKRYTYTRLQRAALGVILGMRPSDLAAYEKAGGPAYIRVLGFRPRAAGLLGEMTRRAALPVITHGKAMDELEGPAASMLTKELEVGDIYRLSGLRGYRHERGMPMVIVE